MGFSGKSNIDIVSSIITLQSTHIVPEMDPMRPRSPLSHPDRQRLSELIQRFRLAPLQAELLVHSAPCITLVLKEIAGNRGGVDDPPPDSLCASEVGTCLNPGAFPIEGILGIDVPSKGQDDLLSRDAFERFNDETQDSADPEWWAARWATKRSRPSAWASRTSLPGLRRKANGQGKESI
jgi:hypothetical protein